MITKTPTKRQRIINYFIDTMGATREDYFNSIFLTYDKYGTPCLALFLFQRSTKPSDHLKFKNFNERAEYIAKQKAKVLKEYENKKILLAKYEAEKQFFVKDAVLFSSWGHEQTNIDFYVIIERKNDFVTLQQVAELREYEANGDRGKCTPDINTKVGQPFKKKITKFASIELASYKYCSIWDGQAKYFSCYA